MEENQEKLIKSPPAGYSNSSATELTTISTLEYLLDNKYVKGDIKRLDKYPNTDGTLEITDKDQIPLGKIEIQIKTLSEDQFKRPTHQCTAKFLSYCEDSILPVILIAVDNTNKKAYWRHIGKYAIQEAAAKMSGQSIAMDIPVQNCIVGGNAQYILDWAEIIKEYRKRIWNYDLVVGKTRNLEEKISQLETQLQQPPPETSIFFKEIHTFLDYYNHILDWEFKAAKELLFFNYWKIGIGIIEYGFTEVSFFLYPIETTKNELLIKVMKPGVSFDLLGAMANREILSLVQNNRGNEIRETPQKYAYKLLKDELLKVIENNYFVVGDHFLAHEYLVSFIDRFYYALGVEPNLQEYDIHNLKRGIFRVLPIIMESELSFGKDVTSVLGEIEMFSSASFISGFANKISQAEKKIAENYVPKVRVIVISSTYNINIIRYFINFLETSSVKNACRQYDLVPPNLRIDRYHPGTWDRKYLNCKLKLFFSNFLRVYQALVEANFPYLVKEFSIYANCDLVICIIRFADPEGALLNRPYLELYKLKADRIFDPKIMFFDESEAKCPIGRKKYFIERDFDCRVDNIPCRIVGMKAQPLDFIFDKSPTYKLMNETLLEKAQEFFREKEKIQG